MNAIRSGAPTFAAYVATILDRASPELSADAQIDSMMVELQLKAARTNATGDAS